MKGNAKYFFNLFFPIMWEILFVTLFFFIVERPYRVYVNLVFYVGLVIYFVVIKREFSFTELKKHLSQKKFWKYVAYTILGLIIAYFISQLPGIVFPNLDYGMATMPANDPYSLTAFIISTIFLPCFGEELYFRKAMICFDSKKTLIVTSIMGICLFAIEHAIAPLGFVQAALWGIPFTLSYIKTKNIYVPMVAHFISDILINATAILYFFSYFN